MVIKLSNGGERLSKKQRSVNSDYMMEAIVELQSRSEEFLDDVSD